MPTPAPGAVVAMDDLAARKAAGACEAIQRARAQAMPLDTCGACRNHAGRRLRHCRQSNIRSD